MLTPFGKLMQRPFAALTNLPWGLLLLKAPTNLTVEIDEVSGGILLSWDAVFNADSYSVYYSLDGGAWQSAATGVSGTSYSFTPNEAGEYGFAVTSVKGHSESAKQIIGPYIYGLNAGVISGQPVSACPIAAGLGTL